MCLLRSLQICPPKQPLPDVLDGNRRETHKHVPERFMYVVFQNTRTGRILTMYPNPMIRGIHVKPKAWVPDICAGDVEAKVLALSRGEKSEGLICEGRLVTREHADFLGHANS
jgi:hypothetical protein